MHTREKWREKWELTSDVGHAINSKEWHKKYAKELLMFMQPDNGQVGVDTGCGAGELVVEMAPYFKKLIGIDYSQSMVEKANKYTNESNVTNVQLFYADMMDIEKHISEKVDFIYNNQVIQYIDLKEVSQFLQKATSLLKSGGAIYFFNIPNITQIESFGIGLFREEKALSWKRIIMKIFSLHFDIFKEKIKNRKYVYDGSLGHWHSIESFRKIADKLNLKVEFYSPVYLDHAYRFHVKFSQKL